MLFRSLHLHGDGRRYKIALACSDLITGLTAPLPGGLRWVAGFETTPSQHQSIRIPFASLRPSVQARPLDLPLRFPDLQYLYGGEPVGGYVQRSQLAVPGLRRSASLLAGSVSLPLPRREGSTQPLRAPDQIGHEIVERPQRHSSRAETGPPRRCPNLSMHSPGTEVQTIGDTTRGPRDSGTGPIDHSLQPLDILGSEVEIPGLGVLKDQRRDREIGRAHV